MPVSVPLRSFYVTRKHERPRRGTESDVTQGHDHDQCLHQNMTERMKSGDVFLRYLFLVYRYVYKLVYREIFVFCCDSYGPP